MNNEQFRKLIQANATKSSSSKQNGSLGGSSRQSGSTPSTLGSRQKASIPMTPRAVSGRVDFARQLAERNQGGQQQQKKFRTSAPRGSKFAQGYVDRAKTRPEEDDDERAERLRALEESLKKEEIDQATYDKLRSQIAGGDLSSTHLVKGLDFKLLERVRKGEDVYKETEDEPPDERKPELEPEEDPDDILDELEAHEVKPMEKEKVQKKGQFAPTSLVPGQKRSRNQILAELKAAREEATRAKEESALGSRFKKIGSRQKPGSRIERDNKGREVLIIVDEDGNERRKVRKLDPKAAKDAGKDAFKPDKNAEVLGMEVPEFYKKQQLEKAKEEEEDEKELNIFDDAGSDYDPLGGLKESDDDESSEEEEDGIERKRKQPSGKDVDGRNDGERADHHPSSEAKPPSGPRNYFKDSKTTLQSEEPGRVPAMSDPTILAALKKVRALEAEAKSEEEIKAAEREARLKTMLQNSNRDDEDMDVDFGTSRVEDEAEGDEARVKLSAWGGSDNEGETKGSKSKRKRGPKKRKGDKNSFADVMRVIDSKKGGDS